MSQPLDVTEQTATAYRNGWMAGLSISALVLAALAPVNLLSVEKSLLAIVLAAIVLSRAAAGAARTRARWALGIGIAHVAIVAAAVILLHDKLAQLVHLLVKLG